MRNKQKKLGGKKRENQMLPGFEAMIDVLADFLLTEILFAFEGVNYSLWRNKNKIIKRKILIILK